MDTISKEYKKLPLSTKIYQTILVLLLVISSGFPLFVNNKPAEMFILIFSAAGVIWYKTDVLHAFRYAALFAVLMFLQLAWFGGFYFTTAVYQSLLFLAAALSASLLKLNLVWIYTRIMCVIAVMATLLFIPILISPNFCNVLLAAAPVRIETVMEAYGYKSTSVNIILMHFPPDFFAGLIRNSGPFWEPGAFGGFLIIAFMFNTLMRNNIMNKENALYTLAIITTFSTTTYLAFLFFITAWYFFRIQNPFIKWGFFFTFFTAAIICFQKIDFLGKKIGTEIKETRYQALMKGGDTRMASAYMDLKEITESPFYVFFGRGSHPKTRVQVSDKEVLRTNGITDLLSRFGLIFFLFAICTLFLTFRLIARCGKAKSHMAYAALATMLILSFSEVYYLYIFFKVLILLYIVSAYKVVYRKKLVHTKQGALRPASEYSNNFNLTGP